MKTRARKMVVNPFVSEVQRRACYAADDPDWDCAEWEKATKKSGKKPVANAKRKAKNPLRIDPTRTAGLRRTHVAKLRRLFAILRGRLRKLIVDDDAFGLKPPVRNVFCATGDGGGVDPTCSPSQSDAESIKGGQTEVIVEPLTVERRGTVGQRGENNAGLFYSPVGQSMPEYGEKTVSSIIPTGTKLFKGLSSIEFIEQNSMLDDKLPKDLIRKTGYKTPRELENANFEGKVDTDIYYDGFQRAAKERLSRYGYDGAHWTSEEDLAPEQYQIWKRGIVGNARQYVFLTSPEKIKVFQQWIKTQVDSSILSQNENALWQAYAEAGWKKGAGRAWDDTHQEKVRKRRPDLFAPEKQDELKGFYAGTRDEFLRSAFNQPISVERIQTLAGRSFDDLKNVTDDMATRLSRTLTDGLTQGKHPYAIAKDIMDDMDISQGRAEMIARTEIIRAHAEGQLDAFEKMGLAEVGVMVEWLATDDDRTCPECESMEGTVYDIDEARGLIPAHPNCRCCFVPQNIGEDKEQEE